MRRVKVADSPLQVGDLKEIWMVGRVRGKEWRWKWEKRKAKLIFKNPNYWKSADCT